MKVGKITGLPIRVLSFRRICIPSEYLRQYGLSAGDEISVEVGDTWLKIAARGVRPCTTLTLQKNQIVRLPMDWARRNRVSTGSCLFLLGTSDGMILYADAQKGGYPG